MKLNKFKFLYTLRYSYVTTQNETSESLIFHVKNYKKRVKILINLLNHLDISIGWRDIKTQSLKNDE